MQLGWDEHFPEIVIPAWQAYLRAEGRLSEAIVSSDEAGRIRAYYDVLREGGAATFYVHHFAEIVLRARPPWLSQEINSLEPLREWLSAACTMLRTEQPVTDVALLRDVADALKHAILTFRLEAREVSANEAVLVISTGYGQGNWGEGKYGGLDQAVVLAKSGRRALSSILQNVIDAWRRVASLDMPEVGAP